MNGSRDIESGRPRPVATDRNGDSRPRSADGDHARPNGREALTPEAKPIDIATRLGDLLIASGCISSREFSKLRRVAGNHGDRKPVSRLIVELGVVSEQRMAEALAHATGFPLVAAPDYPELQPLDTPLALRFLRENRVVPVRANAELVGLAMADPCNDFAAQAIALATDKTVRRCVGTPGDVERAIERLYGEGKSAMGQIVDDAQVVDDGDEIDVEQLKDMASEAPVIRLVNLLIHRAVEATASDIHIEPFEDRLKVRYRVDGVLHETESPPQKLAPAIISRIKIMANLDIAERRLPQDGRVKLRIQGGDVDMRISTVPTMHGESVVIRLLNREDVVLDLASLGFDDAVRTAFVNALSSPNGLILVTGPTGSGKTTTLYTAMNILNTDERKIITAEDPVEYQLEGINQIQVKPAINLTFANALRSIVRQDPDVILVGEMRDLETASICIQSALTGHLVLSTLHTNSAASSITRLLEMGVEDYLLTSTLNAIVSQRLVRKLCRKCRQSRAVSAALLAEMRVEAPDGGRRMTAWRAQGCPDCNGSGYRGRTAILELLVITDEIRRLVMERASAREIEKAAVRGGMRTTQQDGWAKVAAGITTVEEVLRVVQEG